MSDPAALPLPSGFRDRLGEEAEALSTLVRGVLDLCRAHGFRRVQPALVEHEPTLSAWLADGREPPLRLADPLTGAALALRPDLTGQVARIAATRLHGWPRPLRLAYGGPVLRARGTTLDPARERTQAGAEIVGADGPPAVAAIIRLAVAALAGAGARRIAIDLALPGLVGHLIHGPWSMGERADALLEAVESRDRARVERLGGERPARLMALDGDARAALAGLAALPAPAGLWRQMAGLLDELADLEAPLTLDPVEQRGFRYHSWVGFTLFGRAGDSGPTLELGRGGAYRVAGIEQATGFSLYLDALCEAREQGAPARRLFMPMPADRSEAQRLRARGWVVVEALAPDETPEGCSHVWHQGRARPLGGD